MILDENGEEESIEQQHHNNQSAGDGGSENIERIFWNTKTEMLSIIEEDLKLKLEIQDIKRQFLTVLQDFKELDSCVDTEDFHLDSSGDQDSKQEGDLTYSPDPQQSPFTTKNNHSKEAEQASIQSQDTRELPRSDNLEISHELEMNSNNSSVLSDLHPLQGVPANDEDEYIDQYFAGMEIVPVYNTNNNHATTEEDDEMSHKMSTDSMRMQQSSSYDNLTAPNQTAASESTSNWDNVYINNLSKQQDPEIEEEEEYQSINSGAKPKRLKVYIQNIPWDTSSDSSYNVPYPNTKPNLHPELKRALESRNAKSTSSMESSLANISDITKYSEMSSRWINSQTEASDYISCSPEDLPHQSTPTRGGGVGGNKHQDNGQLNTNNNRKRESPTGCQNLGQDTASQFATPVARVSDFCSSLDDSTPIVIQRTRRHLFPGGEDSGITGSTSDYTSSPSTMRENSNLAGPRMDRDQFLLMDENRTFNYKSTAASSSHDTSYEGDSRDMHLVGNQTGASMEATRHSEANEADITTFLPDNDEYTTRSYSDLTSSSSNLSSAITSNVGSSSYKESDGKYSPFTESIDMALRTTIDGEEGYTQMITKLKVSQVADFDDTPCNKPSSASRPPCIGKEATPENNAGSRKSTSTTFHQQFNSPKMQPAPPRDISKKILTNLNNNAHDYLTTSSDSDNNYGSLPELSRRSSSSNKPPLPGYDDMKKKAFAAPGKPNFTSYDGGDSVIKPVVLTSLKDDDVSGKGSKDVINVDQYSSSSKSLSPAKEGGKKKTFFKKLKGIRKHFRSNSRSKAYVKSE